MRDHQDAPIVTTEELAELLGLSRHSIRRWAHSGAIPALKTGRTYRFSVPRVIEALQQAAQAEQARRSPAPPTEPDLEAITQPRRRRAS
jgi:excisionase family DNA binding protein